jgi:hypothetical protein
MEIYNFKLFKTVKICCFYHEKEKENCKENCLKGTFITKIIRSRICNLNEYAGSQTNPDPQPCGSMKSAKLRTHLLQ